MVKPRGDVENHDQILEKVLPSLKEILDGDFMSAIPVDIDRLKWKWPPSTWLAEVKMQKKSSLLLFQIIKTLIKTCVTKFVATFNIRLGEFVPEKYKSELIINSDFKKFDEVLRMVIDCSLKQSKEIEDLLISLHQNGFVTYGIHRSDEAFMTCMVQSATNNKHIHFIDGSDGGYALAAIQLKSMN